MGHRREVLGFGRRQADLLDPGSPRGRVRPSSGVFARANRAGVTSLTFLSVVCAESATATVRVYGSV